MTWQKVASLAELPENGLFRGVAGSTGILIVRMGDSLFATQLNCTHEDDDLSGGTLEDGNIVCGFHYATYDPRSGAVIAPPQGGGEAAQLRTYEVKAVGDDVMVNL